MGRKLVGIVLSLGLAGVGCGPYEEDRTLSVACTSDSMGRVVDCKDQLHVSVVKPDDRIVLGAIYVYEDLNDYHTVVHRAVYRIDNETYVFKGDNNRYGEKVLKTQIKYKVKLVEYAR